MPDLYTTKLVYLAHRARSLTTICMKMRCATSAKQAVRQHQESGLIMELDLSIDTLLQKDLKVINNS